ncbi:hypothetical protein [Flavobacterium sp.]|uniref:hypothetical protein n=1 Tax=Flavobacterium sp. TaxID=239 RepID=UPI00374D07B8
MYGEVSLCLIFVDSLCQPGKNFRAIVEHIRAIGVSLWDTDETSGTIKITSFDGKTLKGEFNISNLTNDNGFPLGYCDGTKIVEKRFNITTGTFTAIP